MKQDRKPEDIQGLLKQFTKQVVERAMQGEMAEHLGYEKHDPEGNNSGNSRNGTTLKTLKGDFGEVEIETPRDRNGEFEPRIVKKNQTRWAGFDDKILSMYSRGMSVRDIQGHLEEMYGVEVSPSLISDVTEGVMEQARAWQSRPLDTFYAIVFLDALYVKMRHEGRVENRAVSCGDRHQPGRQEGCSGAMDGRLGRSKVLAQRPDGAAQPRCQRYLPGVRGRTEGLPAGD